MFIFVGKMALATVESFIELVEALGNSKQVSDEITTKAYLSKKEYHIYMYIKKIRTKKSILRLLI